MAMAGVAVLLLPGLHLQRFRCMRSRCFWSRCGRIRRSEQGARRHVENEGEFLASNYFRNPENRYEKK